MKKLVQSLLKMKRKEKNIDLQEASGRSTCSSNCQAAIVCPKGKEANVCPFSMFFPPVLQSVYHSLYLLLFPRVQVIAELPKMFWFYLALFRLILLPVSMGVFPPSVQCF